MANVLIVEDDSLVAETLQALVEAEGRTVVGLADNLDSAMEIAGEQRVDIALVDIQLARYDSGLQAAAALSNVGIRCIFVTGTAPPFPMPEFALGCISKPCTGEAMRAALAAAEQWPDKPSQPQKPRDYGFQAY